MRGSRRRTVRRIGPAARSRVARALLPSRPRREALRVDEARHDADPVAVEGVILEEEGAAEVAETRIRSAAATACRSRRPSEGLRRTWRAS
jgi:hypothetical protein